MTDTMTIRQNEAGVVRIFALDLPADRVASFAGQDNGTIGTTHHPIAAALGAQVFDPSHVDVLDVDALDDLGLAGLLRQGYDIPQDDIAPLRPQLDALSGHVMLVHSRAVNGTDQTLTPRSPLRWIATVNTPSAQVNFEPLPNPDPDPVLTDPPQKKPVSDAAMSGRVATLALLVLAVLVAVMIWVAG